MKNAARILVIILLLGGLAPNGQAQNPLNTGAMGSRYKDDAELASEHLARGVRAKAKAEKEKDAAKKAKLYEKAKAELLKSVGLDSSYDGLMALGQVYLALGQASPALDACSQAQAFRPGDEPARKCMEEARKAGA